MASDANIFKTFSYVSDRTDYITFTGGKFGSAAVTVDRYGDVYIGYGKSKEASVGPYMSVTAARINEDMSKLSPAEQQEEIHSFISGNGGDAHTVALVGTGIATVADGRTALEAIVSNGVSFGGSVGWSGQVVHVDNPQGTGIFSGGLTSALSTIESMKFSDEVIRNNPAIALLNDLSTIRGRISEYLTSSLDAGGVKSDQIASDHIDGQYAMKQTSDSAMQAAASAADVKQDKGVQVDSSKIDEIKNTEIAVKDLIRNPHSKDLFNAYAKAELEKGGQGWTSEMNKTIAENMLQNGVRPQRVEEALKHSPEKVDNAYYFVKDVRNSPEMQVAQQSRSTGKGIC